MPDTVKYRCLRCGYEYTKPSPEEIEERTCPKCRSNSVRIIRVK